MTKFLIVPTALLALAACATAPVPPIHGGGPGGCNAEAVDRFVGQAATQQLAIDVMRETGAQLLRWIPEGSAVTLEFRHNRVNIRLDRNNRVLGVTCG